MIFDEQILGTRHIHLKWYAQPVKDGIYNGLAMEYWTFFFWTEKGKTCALIGAPHETVLRIPYYAGEKYWGILLKAHLFMPWLAKKSIPKRGLKLPVFANKYMHLNEQKVLIPSHAQAEDYIDELIARGIIANHPLVERALAGQPVTSERTAQRHMLQIAGLSRRELERIRRARYAYVLLHEGNTIADVVAMAGYVDQAHLTKSLKALAGQTPGEIMAAQTGEL